MKDVQIAENVDLYVLVHFQFITTLLPQEDVSKTVYSPDLCDFVIV